MKKILSFILVIIMILSLVACGEKTSKQKETENVKEEISDKNEENTDENKDNNDKTEENNVNKEKTAEDLKKYIADLPVAEDFKWTFENGVLTISGNGAMPPYYIEGGSRLERPWDEHEKEVTEIVISEGITTVSAAAFQAFDNLVKVTLPASVKGIGFYSFSGCEKLTELSLSDGIVIIDRYAFNYCESLTEFKIPDELRLFVKMYLQTVI